MWHILLLLPFLLLPSLLPFFLDGLLADVVLEHNRANPFNPAFDPSSELIGITTLFIQWYHLHHRQYPPKDEMDIKDLTSLSEQ